MVLSDCKVVFMLYVQTAHLLGHLSAGKLMCTEPPSEKGVCTALSSICSQTN